MSRYFKENGSTCETSPTALFVFKDSGDFKDGAEVPAEWQRSELVAEVKDIREINLTPPAITTELFIPPTRQSDSQKKSGPMFKSHYRNKQKYNQNWTHNAFPKWTEVVSPEKTKKAICQTGELIFISNYWMF